MSSAMKVLVNDIIILEHILKFIEIVLKYGNDFKISEFYRVLTFRKKNEGPGSCSTSSRAGTRLTVHRALP